MKVGRVGEVTYPTRRPWICHLPLNITSPGLSFTVSQMGQSWVAFASVWSEDPGLCSKMHLGLKLTSTSQQLCDPLRHPTSLSLFTLLWWEGNPAG